MSGLRFSLRISFKRRQCTQFKVAIVLLLGPAAALLLLCILTCGRAELACADYHSIDIAHAIDV